MLRISFQRSNINVEARITNKGETRDFFCSIVYALEELLTTIEGWNDNVDSSLLMKPTFRVIERNRAA